MKSKLSKQIQRLSEGLNQYEERKRLREYLSRYDTIVKSKDRLAIQLSTVRSSVGTVRSEKGKRKLEEFEARLDEEKAHALEVANEIKAIIAYLPLGSTPRQILELRYIMRYSWKKISATIYHSVQHAELIESKAIDELLKVDAVKAQIGCK